MTHSVQLSQKSSLMQYKRCTMPRQYIFNSKYGVKDAPISQSESALLFYVYIYREVHSTLFRTYQQNNHCGTSVRIHRQIQKYSKLALYNLKFVIYYSLLNVENWNVPLSQKLLEKENWVTRQWMPRGNVDCVNGISAAKEVRLKRFKTGVTEPPTWRASLEVRNKVVMKFSRWTWEQHCLLLIHGSLLQSQPIQILHQGKQTMRTIKSQERAVTIIWLITKPNLMGQRSKFYLGNSQTSRSDFLFTAMWIKFKMHLCWYQSVNRNINILDITYKQNILTRLTIYKKRKAYITWVTSSDKIHMLDSISRILNLSSKDSQRCQNLRICDHPISLKWNVWKVFHTCLWFITDTVHQSSD